MYLFAVINRFDFTKKAFVKLINGENKIKLVGKNCFLEIKLFYNQELVENEHQIRVLYVTCIDDDGDFQSPRHLNNSCNSALSRISLNIKLLQTLMAEILFKKFGVHKTFQLVKNKTVCEQFKSCLRIEEALKMTAKDLFIHLASEISSRNDIFDKNCKYVAILSFTRYEPPKNNNSKDIFENTKGFCALGNCSLGILDSMFIS